ncbi:MAG: cyclic nucleotide-binding domain-containing protein, partial [Pseudaminobacter sp.]
MTFSAQTFQFFLQSLPIGAELNSAEITNIQSISVTQKYYPPHTLITGQGEFEHRIFFVNSGWGCVYRDLANGDRLIIDFPLRGDIMGMRSAEG